MAGVVVVGGGAAGDAAALTARRHGFSAPITIVSAEPHRPCERPLLSKELLSGKRSETDVFIRAESAYANADVDLRLGVTATAIDADTREVHLDSGERLAYDTLVLATGSSARSLPSFPDAANVLRLRTRADALRIRDALQPASRVFVVGAGFLGCELAAAARTRGCSVTLCDVSLAPMTAAVGDAVGAAFARLHISHGTDVRMSVTVRSVVLQHGDVAAVELSDGTRLDVDTVLVAVGAQPELHLAEDLGLPLRDGGVAVDAGLRAAPDVFCAGDVATHLHPVLGANVRIEHWQVAQRQGEHIGRCIATGQDTPHNDVPWFWSDQHDWQLTQAGWPGWSDSTVVRGDPKSSSFTVFHLRRGALIAAISVNDARTVRRARTLIAHASAVETGALRDSSIDLRELAAVS